MSNPVRVNYCMYCMEPLAEGEVICPKCGYDNRNTRNRYNHLPYTVLTGKYLVGRSLEQSEFAITYIGLDLNLLTKVAIKEYFPEDIVTRDNTGTLNVVVTSDENQTLFSKGRERFLWEAQTLAKLDDCDTIVRVRDFFQEHGTAYIVMDYIEGTPLTSYIAPFPRCMTFEEVVRLLSPLLTQLDEVHGKHILHRDICPDNIVIRGNGRPVLINFGSVHEDGYVSPSYALRTDTGGYSPVERHSVISTQNASMDVYSMTATLYSLLCGVRPVSSIERIAGVKLLIPPTKLNPTLTKAQEQVLLKGMSPHAQDRYPSMGALNAALTGALTGARAMPPTLHGSRAPYSLTEPTTMPKPLSKESIIAIVSAAVAVIALVIALVPSLMNRMGNQPQSIMSLGAAMPAATSTPIPGLAPTLTPTDASAVNVDWSQWDFAAAPTAVPTATPQPAPVRYTLMNETIGYLIAYAEKLTVFSNTEYTRDQIHTITFIDTLDDAPASAWDVSVEQTGGIMAWVEKENGQNNLIVASNDVIQANEDSSMLFIGYKNVESIRFNGRLDTSNVTDMGGMFSGCSSLTQLDASHFDTKNVIDMGRMFCDCKSLTQLDVSGFDTANVTYMHEMFYGCESLTQLDISCFDTGNVTDMSGMFFFCSSLTQLNVSNFDTKNVTDMCAMFDRCLSLTQLDVSGFDTANVTNMGWMFELCSSLTQLNVSGFDTRNVTNMWKMFRACRSLTQLDVSSFDTANVTVMKYMFVDCSQLRTLKGKEALEGAKGCDKTDMYLNCPAGN